MPNVSINDGVHHFEVFSVQSLVLSQSRGVKQDRDMEREFSNLFQLEPEQVFSFGLRNFKACKCGKLRRIALGHQAVKAIR